MNIYIYAMSRAIFIQNNFSGILFRKRYVRDQSFCIEGAGSDLNWINHRLSIFRQLPNQNPASNKKVNFFENNMGLVDGSLEVV